MDVLLREHKVYVDTVKLITNIKIFCKTINTKPSNIHVAKSTNFFTKALQ